MSLARRTLTGAPALAVEAESSATAGEKLAAGEKAGAGIVTEPTQDADEADLQVLPFGFRHCRPEPGRFT
jgi:hypothetical protein